MPCVRYQTLLRTVDTWGTLEHPDDPGHVGQKEKSAMIFITAKFQVRPEDAEAWPEISRAFTEATRSEPGCLWFEWSRSLDDPAEYVLVEAFRDGDAGAAHVQSEHFRAAQEALPPHLAATPKVVHFSLEQDDWSELGEMRVPSA